MTHAQCRATGYLRTLYACKSRLYKAVLDGATCHTRVIVIVTHRGSVTPGEHNMKTFTLVQFDFYQPVSAESVA